MKKLLGVCILSLMLAFSAYGQHVPVGSNFCPYPPIEGACACCGGPAMVHEAPTQEESTLPTEGAALLLFLAMVIVARRIIR